MESNSSAVNQIRTILVDKWLNTLLNGLHPPTCLLCRIATGKYDICPDCDADLPRIPHGCHRCGLGLVRPSDRLCGACLRQPPHFDSTIAALAYQFPVSGLIQQFKFGRQLATGRLLAQLLADTVANCPEPLPDMLYPVPMHRWRRASRGFNQAMEIGRDLAHRFGLGLDQSALVKTCNTAPQAELSRRQRQGNLRGVFEFRRTSSVPATAALIDDVMTTGSTVNECARTLKRAGVEKVSVWVVARAV